MRHRPASGVLALLWTVAEIYYVGTGERVPVDLYLATDFIILGALMIFANGCWSEAVIAAILVLQFKCYTELPHGEAMQWWSLWTLTVIQMSLAGPWRMFLRSKEEMEQVDPVADYLHSLFNPSPLGAYAPAGKS